MPLVKNKVTMKRSVLFSLQLVFRNNAMVLNFIQMDVSPTYCIHAITIKNRHNDMRYETNNRSLTF